MGVEWTWVAVDAADRVILLESDKNGAWTSRALTLEMLPEAGSHALFEALRLDQERSECPALVFEHDYDDPAPLYVRAGGQGTLRASDLPAELVDAARVIRLDLDGATVDEIDLSAHLSPIDLGLEDAPDPIEADAPSEPPEPHDVPSVTRRLVALFLYSAVVDLGEDSQAGVDRVSEEWLPAHAILGPMFAAPGALEAEVDAIGANPFAGIMLTVRGPALLRAGGDDGTRAVDALGDLVDTLERLTARPIPSARNLFERVATGFRA